MRIVWISDGKHTYLKEVWASVLQENGTAFLDGAWVSWFPFE